MEHNFIVNIDSVKKLSNEIGVESNNLNAILDSLINMSNEINTFFDTPTAKVFSETLLKFLNNAKIPCQNLDELSKKISLFGNSYTNLYNSTKRSVGAKV